MSIEIKGLSFSYDAGEVLRGIDFTAADGELVAVLGPNGVGKSTLFRCMLGFLKPKTGVILVNGKRLGSLSRAETAREIAYIPQSVTPAFNYTVLDTTLMGMTNRLSLFSTPRPEHIAEAMEVLESLGIAHLAHRGVGAVSGGERQLTLLARALVQNAKVLIMDEPTANLDYGNSYRVMERVSGLAGRGYTVIFSTHDPNQAFRHATRVLVIKDGRILTQGAPDRALTESNLSRLYGIRVAVRTVELEEGPLRLSIPQPEQHEADGRA